MLDQDFHTLCVMTATIRAGKAGAADKAWANALEEAVAGWAMLQRNRHALAKIMALQSATPLQSAEVPQSAEELQTT